MDFRFEIDIRCALAALMQMLPPGVRIHGIKSNEGEVSLTLRSRYSRVDGLHIAALNIAGGNFFVQPPQP